MAKVTRRTVVAGSIGSLVAPHVAFAQGSGNTRVRFAIDWVQLGPDGRLFHGDPNSNANLYGYGAEVLAVADGRVSDRKDSLPENVGSNEPSTRAITLDNITGNYLILDLGHGRGTS